MEIKTKFPEKATFIPPLIKTKLTEHPFFLPLNIFSDYPQTGYNLWYNSKCHRKKKYS